MGVNIEAAIRENSGDLLRYFLWRIPNREEAADALGEVLLIAWRTHRKMPDEPVAARMWLFGIARNVLLHVQRGNARKLRLAAEIRAAVEMSHTEHATDEALDVRNAIAELPTDLAELVRLIHWDGFSIVEAARLQHIPASTARSRYAKARALLRDLLSLTPVESR